MVDLDALLARLERADGAERALDGAIYWHLLEPNRDEFKLEWRELQFSTDKGNGDWRKPYTSSIDAAVELTMSKLPGTEWAISTLNDINHAEVNMNATEPVTAQRGNAGSCTLSRIGARAACSGSDRRMRERWDAALGAEIIFWAFIGTLVLCLVMGSLNV